jgi:hypothetical protein
VNLAAQQLAKQNSGQILKNGHGKYFGHTIIVKRTLCYFLSIVIYCPIDKVEEFDATTTPLQIQIILVPTVIYGFKI